MCRGLHHLTPLIGNDAQRVEHIPDPTQVPLGTKSSKRLFLKRLGLVMTILGLSDETEKMHRDADTWFRADSGRMRKRLLAQLLRPGVLSLDPCQHPRYSQRLEPLFGRPAAVEHNRPFA